MRRHSTGFVAAFLSLLVLFVMSGGQVAADNAAPIPTPTSSPLPLLSPPSAPTALWMSLPQTSRHLPAGSWISASSLNVRFHVDGSGDPVVPQVEFVPSSRAFKGQPTSSGQAMSSSGTALVAVNGLSNGKTYHWQARVIDQSGTPSAWVPFAIASSTPDDIGVDQTSPSRPIIRSDTNPDENRWYNNKVVSLSWNSYDSVSGIRGYSFVLERRAHVIPPGAITAQRALQLATLTDGVWFLALRSVDRAGNWSPTATFRIQLDRQAPSLKWLSPSRFTFNPYQGPTTVRFSVSKDASVNLALYRVGDRTATQTFSFPLLRAGQIASLTWSGKDRSGKPAARGYYFLSTTAVDHANNMVRVNLGGIDLVPVPPERAATGQLLYPNGGKLIIVSLSRQTLYAYDGARLAVQTFVTTGNPNLPTPPGSYTILGKYSPWEFISPWPAGSPYWYPPSWSHYAMLFRAGGYFLHDAPWRSVFGPGSNGPGQPGTNYGGTHGCVNIPPDPMLFLWNWAPVGTPVDVVQ